MSVLATETFQKVFILSYILKCFCQCFPLTLSEFGSYINVFDSVLIRIIIIHFIFTSTFTLLIKRK